MENLLINTKQKQHSIIFDKIIDNFSNLSNELEKLYSRNCSVFIITDDNVKPLYGNSLLSVLTEKYDTVSLFSICPGEKSKTLDTVSGIYNFLIENKGDRNSVLIALGGGVVGDVTGFVAATYMRGIKFVQIPTTLLSQVDSSVGGKTGVDFSGYKNIIGAFYQPDLVYINIKMLDSLPNREFSNGIAEVVKYGFIMDADFFEYLTSSNHDFHSSDILLVIVKRCVTLKAEIVEQDKNDTGIREILNFGHTFGHAIESLKEFELLHGECVALGIISALQVSTTRGKISVSQIDKYVDFMKSLDLPITVSGITPEQVYAAMLKDKKSKSGKISFVLLNHLGEAVSTNDLSYEEVINGIKRITKGL